MTDHTGKKPLHRAKIIARKAAKALADEDAADIVPALAMLVAGTLQQNFHDIEDARAILQQIRDFEDDFLNDAFPGGHPPAEVQAEQAQFARAAAEVREEIGEDMLAAQQLAAEIEDSSLRGTAVSVQMFAIAFLATRLAVTHSDTISEARSMIDAIYGTAKQSLAPTFEEKQRGITRQ